MAKTPVDEWVLKDYLIEYEALRLERDPFEAEARRISSYILPGRGVFNNLTRPAKRKLTAPKVVNPAAKDALKVLTSGLQGGLTPPSRPWFKLSFSDPRFQQHPVLSAWLYEAEKRLYAAFSASNFYQCIHSLYTEYAGFGTAPLFVGEDGEPFRFELLTFGEYCIGLDSKGRVNRFYRIIFRTGQMLKDDYEEKLPESLKKSFEMKQNLNSWYTLLEATTERKTGGKPYTRIIYLLGMGDGQNRGNIPDLGETGCVLSRGGFHEFPYPTARWDVIGSDIYGIGAGAEALPDTIRLQEMEKAFLMAVHKAVDPPLFVPAHLKGKVKTLPGGVTYSRNTMNEKVASLYEGRFDIQGVAATIERVEKRIQRIFFNDVFLTASRDPNASPMKARQVEQIENEGVLRLGPVIERAWYEFLQPVLERCFNIMLRKGKFPQLDPQMQALLNGADFTIALVSVLAQQQKAIGAQPIQSFLQFISVVASVDQTALDKIDIDATIDEFADITGVPSIIMRSPEEVDQIRKQRQAAMAAQQKQQEDIMMQQLQDQSMASRATTAKAASEAGVNVAEVMGGGDAGLQ